MTEPKTHFLTGCASGIGFHLADRLLADGHRVVATDLDEGLLRQRAQEHGWPEQRVTIARLDVSNPDDWDAVMAGAMEQFETLDVLMNVAGYLLPGHVHELQNDAIHRHFDVNVKGVVFGTRAAAKIMVSQGHGHIINIASLAGLAPIPGLALYSASKYAVRSFSLAAAQELQDKGVQVTVFCPDVVQTPMLDLQRNYEEAVLSFSGDHILTVEEVGDAIFGKVLGVAPLEVWLPESRAWLARLTDIFPRAIRWVHPMLERRGRTRQKPIT